MKNELEEKRQKGRKRLEVLTMIMCVIMTFWKGIEVSIIWITFAHDCLTEWAALSDWMINAISDLVVAIPSGLLAIFVVYALSWVFKYAKVE